MQDACDASLNAARLCFKNSTVLMCYFHVMQNTKKHQNLISSNLYDDLLVDLRNIHYSRNENEYNGFIINFEKKYKKIAPKMLKYIKEQWLEKYNNWQIFRNPPGYANTNSNIESFNASIKRDFTFRKKLSVYVAVNKIKEIVHYYSVNKEIFHTIPKFYKKYLIIREN